MDNTDIENLVNGIANGDRKAFRRLYEKYQQKVYKTAVMLTRDERSAEDIVQDVFTIIYTKIYKLTHPAAFESWLYKIVINSCYSYLRKNRKNIIYEDDEIEQVQERSISAIPEAMILRNEISLQLDRCINKLSEKLKVCIVLFYFNNMSIREIADILDCSEGTVKSRLSNGKKQLEKILNAENAGEVGIYGYK